MDFFDIVYFSGIQIQEVEVVFKRGLFFRPIIYFRVFESRCNSVGWINFDPAWLLSLLSYYAKVHCLDSDNVQFL